jgi:hypothetical protein
MSIEEWMDQIDGTPNLGSDKCAGCDGQPCIWQECIYPLTPFDAAAAKVKGSLR